MMEDPRLTREEIEALVRAGRISITDIKRLHPEERKDFYDISTREELKNLPMIANGPAAIGAASAVAPRAAGAIVTGAKKAWNALGGPAVSAGVAASGHPFLGMAVGHAMNKLKFAVPKAAGVPAAGGPPGAPAQYTGTGGAPPSQINTTGNQWSGLRSPSGPPTAPRIPDLQSRPPMVDPGPGSAPRMPSFSPPKPEPKRFDSGDKAPFAGGKPVGPKKPVQRYPPDHRESNSTLMENVTQKGVTNDFRGRVTFRKDPPTPKSREEDLRNLSYREIAKKLGLGKKGYEGYGPSSDPEVEALRKFLAQILDGAK